MPERSRPAPGDERGAILLIALFFSVFLVGVVYYVIGVAEAVLMSERMQDAVDASALSGAVMHARAMNFIVLVNIVMSALLAILVALKLVETLAILGMILATALAWPTFGATLALIPPLEAVRMSTSQAYQNSQEPVFQALERLNDLADIVASAAPISAQAIATLDVNAHWKPPVEYAVAVAARQDMLPVEDDSFDVLCGRAGGVVGGIAALPFSALGPVKSAIEEASSSAAREFSGWFCGSGSGSGSGGPPSIPQTVKHYYPSLPSTAECQSTKDEGDCARAGAEEDDAKPDPETGECQSGHDCSLSGPYETNVAAARRDCDPTQHPAPVEYWWQEQTGTVSYVWNGEAWERGETRYDAPVQRHVEFWPFQPPCGPESVRPTVATGYELSVHPNGDVNEINPVCSAGGQPPLPLPVTPTRGTVQAVPIQRVTHILGCRRDFRESVRGADAEPATSGDDRGPKRVRRDVTLGAEDFQIRAFARRQARMAGPGQAVRVALWGADAPDAGLANLNELGRYSVAQAEYFYDGAEEREAWMWSMKWRARLKRFRVPTDPAIARAFETSCTATSPESGAFLDALGRLGELVMH